jgi:hypothetical protein
MKQIDEALQTVPSLSEHNTKNAKRQKQNKNY